MNVISNTNEILDSTVSLQNINGIFGLVLESRSGAKGSLNKRNPDYSVALEAILQRLMEAGVETIRIYLASRSSYFRSMDERSIEVEGEVDIVIKDKNPNMLRKQIGVAQTQKKEHSLSKGGNPTKKILIHADISNDSWKAVIHNNTEATPISEEEIVYQSDGFDPANVEETREKVIGAIAIRLGQPKFRENLLQAYDGRCAITDTNITCILEAAHIIPYHGSSTNHVANGILLRADIHTLFDFGLVGIGQEYQIVTASSIRDGEYGQYHGNIMRLPKKDNEKPSLIALASRPLPNIN